MRHAETEWSLYGRHTGRTDIPLTAHGREAARELPGRLAGLALRARARRARSARARETCELTGLAAQARVGEDLREWDYGEYEGLTSAQIERLRPGWSLWRDGCPGGECASDVAARADRVIALIASAEAPAAVFSHGHLLRVLGARWAQLEPFRRRAPGLFTAAICVLGHEHGLPVIVALERHQPLRGGARARWSRGLVAATSHAL